MIIQPIVEGQGEVAAVPLLLRRLQQEAQCWGLGVGKPHRKRRSQLVKKDTLQIAVEVAALRDDCAGILVLFDADDDCPKELAPTLEQWAREAAGGKPCVVVMANREYEAWFLASIEALRGKAGILPDAASHPQPEMPRDAKGELERRMSSRVSYSPTVDQAARRRLRRTSTWRARTGAAAVSASSWVPSVHSPRPLALPPQCGRPPRGSRELGRAV